MSRAATAPRLGAVLPSRLAGGSTSELIEFAQALESLGARHLTLFDHVLGADPTHRTPPVFAAYDYRTPFREPLVLSAFLAAVTHDLEFATGVLALPQRQAALVAKQAAEVALLSDGRLRLGVGVGLNPIEFQALDADFSTRGARQSEQIEVMRRLWAEELVDYTGQWHRIDRAGIAPRPAVAVPVWLGGMAEVALARAARLADGYIGVVHSTSDLPIIERVVALAAGRPTAGTTEFGVEALIDQQPDAASYRELTRALLDVGATHITVRTDAAGDSVADHVAAVARFIDSAARA